MPDPHAQARERMVAWHLAPRGQLATGGRLW